MTTYRCPNRACPIKKRCFICKTTSPVPEGTTFLVKCPAFRKDIMVNAGTAREAGILDRPQYNN